MAWSWGGSHPHSGHIKGPLQGEMSTLKWHFCSPSLPENNLNHQHHVWLLRKLLWRPRLWKLRLWRPGLWLWLLLQLWLPQAGLWLWMRLWLWLWLLLLRTPQKTLILYTRTPGFTSSEALMFCVFPWMMIRLHHGSLVWSIVDLPSNLYISQNLPH